MAGSMEDTLKVGGENVDPVEVEARLLSHPAVNQAKVVGVPVLFSRAHFEDLLALGPGEGCKGVILRHIDKAALLECPQAEADIDTPEDYARLCTKP